MDQEGHAYPSQELIAAGAGQSRKTVNRNIEKARKAGWLHIRKVNVEGQTYHRNEYYATAPMTVELTDTDEMLTDYLVAEVGDVGEDSRSPMSAETNNEGTFENNEGTFEPELRDISAHNEGTPGLQEHSIEHNIEHNSIEGPTPDGSGPLFPGNGRSKGLAHVSDVLPDHSAANQEVRQEKSPHADSKAAPSPDGIADGRRDRILQLARLEKFTVKEIAKMANVPESAVAALLTEVAA
jgi:biotin operon repressor